MKVNEEVLQAVVCKEWKLVKQKNGVRRRRRTALFPPGLHPAFYLGDRATASLDSRLRLSPSPCSPPAQTRSDLGAPLLSACQLRDTRSRHRPSRHVTRHCRWTGPRRQTTRQTLKMATYNTCVADYILWKHWMKHCCGQDAAVTRTVRSGCGTRPVHDRQSVPTTASSRYPAQADPTRCWSSECCQGRYGWWNA